MALWRWIFNTDVYTHDGNRRVICEHHVMKPSVIMIADPNAIKHDRNPRTASKNNPKNDESIFFNCRYDILEGQNQEHWLNGSVSKFTIYL